MPSQVGQSKIRTRLFSPDSGIENSPTPGVPRVGVEAMSSSRYNRRIEQCTPFPAQGRASEEGEHGTNNEEKSSWLRFWLIWAILLTLTGSLVIVIWTYFPQNRVVQKSQEYVMTGLIATFVFVVLSGIVKVVFQCFMLRKTSRINNQTTSVNDLDYESYAQNNNADFQLNEAEDEQFYDPRIMPENSVSRENGQSALRQPNSDYQMSGQKPGITENTPETRESGTPDRVGAPLTNKAVSDFDVRDKVNGDLQPGETTDAHSSNMNADLHHVRPSSEYPVRRTFSGSNNEVWNEFIRYFENMTELNDWNKEKARRVLLSTFRGQAETYAYGMPLVIQRDIDRLKVKMEERFGHTAMKEKYVTEAKLRRRQPNESLRDFGQSIEDLFRRAYPSNPEIVEENAIKYFLDKCGQSEDFRLAVKRMRPKTLQEAVFYAMQEECLRAGEKDLTRDTRPTQRRIYEVGEPPKDMEVSPNNYYGSPHANYDNYNRYCAKDESRYQNYERLPRGVNRFQRRPRAQGHGNPRGRGNMYQMRNNVPDFQPKVGSSGDSEEKPLN